MYWEIKHQKNLGSINAVVQDIKMILFISVPKRWAQTGAELARDCQGNKGV